MYGDFNDFLRHMMDPQAERVYWAQKEEFYPMTPVPKSAAEEQARTRAWLAQPGEFASVNAQQAFVRSVQRSKLAKDNWPKFASATPVVLVEKSQEPGSMAYTNTKTRSIYVAPDYSGRLRVTSLHELAHVIGIYEDKEDNHGPQFVGIFRKLVAEYFPAHVASLDKRYKKWHVTWTT